MSCKDTRIIDFIEFNPKLTLKKGTVARKIPMENLAPFTRDVYSNTYEPYNGGAKFQNKDTIVARITPSLENGKTAFINHLNKDEIAFGSTEFIVLRAISGVSYPQFVYYFSTSTLFRDNAIASMTGTSGRQRVQENTLYDLIYRLPSLDKQKAIANILSSLDDKIELNNKINKNLEELAQTLYKQWFVDFEFPNEYGEPYKSSGGEMFESEMGLIPKGWKITQLKDIFNFIGGFAFKGNREVSDGKYKIVTIKNVQDGYMNTSTLSSVDRLPDRIKSSQILEIGDILVSLTGNVGRTCIVNLNHCLLNQRVEKVEPMIKYLKGFVYTYFRNIDTFNKMLTLSKGSAQQNLSPIEISNIIIPINIELKNLFESFNEIFQMILSNQLQIKKLSKLRDELLPKLMNGEIEVPIEE